MNQYIRTNKHKEKTLPTMNESMNTYEQIKIPVSKYWSPGRPEKIPFDLSGDVLN